MQEIKIIDLFDSIPRETIVVIMNWTNSSDINRLSYINQWKEDSVLWGKQNTLYHKFKSLGLSKIDSFYRLVPFIFILSRDKNGDYNVGEQVVGNNMYDQVATSQFIYKSNELFFSKFNNNRPCQILVQHPLDRKPT